MSFQMHNTARWTARRSYVALAFILIILALILAGCLSTKRDTKATVVFQTRAHALAPGCKRIANEEPTPTSLSSASSPPICATSA